MNMVNRAAGRSGRNKIETNSTTVSKTVIKTENIKLIEKEKKQPTPDQIRLASLIDKTDSPSEISDKIREIQDITWKSEEEALTALYDCDNNVTLAVQHLLEGKMDEWSTTTKKKKNRTASASKNDTKINNNSETAENSEEWDKEANINSGNQNEKNSRGFRGRRGAGPRSNDRGAFNRRWRGRENKENERNAEDGSNTTSAPNRDYRGRSDRMTNGPSRLGRGGRGSRGGRGPGGTRTFQNRDNNDRGGGFPRQIDTWNNPETENTVNTVGEFPSPEDWDNEEYTGSLADTKVFTPSTAVEAEAVETAPSIGNELKDESMQLHMSMQSSPNANIQTMVVGSNQLTAAQTQYFNQLAAQANENRKQQAAQQVTQQKPQQVQQPQSSVIYNSSITSPQQPFSTAVTQSSFTGVTGVSQSFATVTPSQPFTAMVSSQTFQQSSSSSYQSPSPISGSSSYTRNTSEYTSANYNDVMNYNSIVGLQNNGSLPQRTKPQRPSRQETPTKVISGSVDIPSAEGTMNSAINYLDAQFSALDFNNSDSFESTTGTNDPSSVAALSNKYSQNVSASASHSDLPAMNSFQAAQPSKQNLPSSNISSVLNQNNKLSADSTLQNENSVYSSQTITNSRMASSIQDLKNNTEVSSLSYGLPETYQSQQQQSTFQKPSSNVSSSFHQSGTSVPSYSSAYGANTTITSTSANVYTGQQQQSQQQQSQISGTGVTYTTNSSTSFSIYSSNSHSIATATPPLHNSVYHNSYQPHPSVTASFQSYLSYPSSIMQPYQTGAAGLTQSPYLSTQYGGGSLASLSATYGAAPFHNNYGVSNNIQTPMANLQPSHKISNSLSTSVASKDSQYDTLQAITSASNNTATTTSGSVITGLSQASTTTSSKVSSSNSGNKSSGMLPSIPPGVTPLLGPQYIMSQGTLPMYQPAFTFNYEDLQYIQRGMHPPMPGYLDLNYATASQTNLAAAGRDGLSVPFSSISDGRFPRPDNTTSPVPPAAAAAAGASLSQQNTAPTHQQPHMPLVQTYATAYIYPPYQQYTTPVYQVAPTATPAAPGSSTNAALTAASFAKAPTGYNSTGYPSQYDSLGSNQGNVADYSSKGNSASTYSNNQQSSKSGGNAGSISTQNANAGNSDLSMYSKSHATLTKSYDKQTFHSGTPPPFTMPGSGTTSSNLGNVSNVSAATGYGPQFLISGVPTAAAAHQQHHLHQNAHHQDAGDIRNAGTNERNFFLPSNRSSYR